MSLPLPNRWFHLAGAAVLMSSVACGSLLGVDFSDAHSQSDAGTSDSDSSGPDSPDGGAFGDGGTIALGCARGPGPCGDAACPGSSGDIVAIEASGNLTCALERNGAVRCWLYGKAPRDVQGLENRAVRLIGRRLGTGMDVVTASGSIARVNYDGESFTIASPELVGFVASAHGQGHSCYLAANCRAQCIGVNSLGQLGDDSTLDRASLVDVALDGGASRILAGYNTSCAQLSDGTTKCWGARWNWRAKNPQQVPEDQIELSGATLLASGGMYACAARESWVGCVGEESRGWWEADGVVIDLALDETHACLLTQAGAVKCWGKNFNGELGNGTRSEGLTWSNLLTDVVGLGSGVVDVTAGTGHSCALLADGRVLCWGAENGSHEHLSTFPVEVPGL